MYYLKLFNKTLLRFDMDKELNVSNIDILCDDIKLFPENLKEVNSESVKHFILNKLIPKNRANLECFLSAVNIELDDFKAILDYSKGLSIIDAYWITRDDGLRYEDFNLFDNDISKELSLSIFNGTKTKINNTVLSPEFTTNGAIPKCWIKKDDGYYLYKSSTGYLGFANTGNEPYSEYYACQLLKELGIPYINYDLEMYQNELVSVCKIFTSKDIAYVPIHLIANIDDIDKAYNWCLEHNLEEAFGNMIIFDALIYNHDRHLGNFGIIKDNHTGDILGMAPIFDNGAGLLAYTSLSKFKDLATFEDYYKNNNDFNRSNYWIDFRDLVKKYCTDKQLVKLKRLDNFKFTKHPRYNLLEGRLEYLNILIDYRIKELMSLF
mgnify:FL=1